MPLPALILDDRSYQQLRDELVRRIPVYAPEWTDHSASDPGITLIELFAFLGENLLYRFNQIPEATKLEFLRRLQIPLRKAQSARTLIAFTTKDLDGHLVELHTQARAGKVPFETEEEVHVWPLAATAAAKYKTAPPDPADHEAWDFLQAAQLAAELGTGEVPVYYENLVVPADPTAPNAPVVDFQSAVDGMLWIAVTETMGVRDPIARAAARGKLTKALESSVINLGVLFDELAPAMNEVDPCFGEGELSAAPPMVWQVSTTKQAEDPVFQTLNIVGDSTRGFTRQGVVRLMLPGSMDSVGPPTVPDPDAAGTGEYPPELHDDNVSENLLFWLRAFRPEAGTPSFGRVQWLGLNATGVIQSSSTNPEFLGMGKAREPDQTFRLLKQHVIESSMSLEVEESGSWTPWVPVEGFWSSGEDDRHYVLEAEAGQVKFGNGIHGRAPQIGERIRVRSYRHGGGPEGNVAARGINKSDVAGVKLANPMAAMGGGPAESVAEALDRLPAEFRRRDRAVTRGDFQELALMTPGAAVGRAECLPLFHPASPDLKAAGVVAVVVWPLEDSKHPNAPLPTSSLLSSVCLWLDLRRLVTTELYVIPPTYRKVACSIGVEVKSGYGIEAVRRWVELVIRQYLAPLPPFGPEGKGWPLGRRVHGPELEAAALQVEGVEFLYGLDVAGMGDDGNWSPGTVTMERYEVPELTEITVVAGREPIPPGDPINPIVESTPIPIPVTKDVC